MCGAHRHSGGQVIAVKPSADHAAHAADSRDNLAALLSAQAETRPHAPALIDYRGSKYRGGKRTLLRFADLARASAQAAALLAQSGLQPGDRVLVFHPMAADLYVALTAIFRLGLVALFIDPGMGRAYIDRCCAYAPPQALLATPKAHLLRLLSSQVRRIPIKFATGWGAPFATRWARYADQPPHIARFAAHSDTPALATFTSGSTGAPKLAVRTHGFLHRQHAVLERTLPLQPGADTGTDKARVLTTLPIFALSRLAAGHCVVIPDVDIRRPGAVKAAPILRRIEADNITCLEGSPAFLARLAQAAHAQRITLPHVTQVFTGGAPVFPSLLDAVQRLAPNAQVTAVYGSTEAEPIAHISHADLTEADRTADREAMRSGQGLLTGTPVPEVAVRILPDRWGTPLGPYTQAEFTAQSLPASEVGEIVVSGAHVLPGYWQGAGDAENKVRVTDTQTGETGATTVWHRTGDAGRLDADGRLWLLGRCSARIHDTRGTLYPFAVECAAHEHPRVRQAALVQIGQQRVLAVAGTLTAENRAALGNDLAWAQIDAVRVLDALPVDPRHNAKIDYAALQKRLQG